MSEIVGKIACGLCGHVNNVKKSKTGRFTAVCRWQDGGCGSQLQTLTADAGMRIMKKMQPSAKPDEKPSSRPDGAKPEQGSTGAKPKEVGSMFGGFL